MKAFSLPELIVVLVLIGLLTTLGVSRYNAYVAGARQAEAKVNLTHIASLQGIYRSQHLKYNTLSKVGAGNCGSTTLNNTLGFRPKGCGDLRYGYECPSAKCGTSAFEATAESRASSVADQQVYPGCDKSDKWTITQDLALENSDPVVKKCDE